MSVTPTRLPEDDAVCFDRVSRWINSAVYRSVPTDVYLVRIDNWFGDRWLSFAGKAAGGLGIQGVEEGLTLPPFHPHRVIGRPHFRRYESLGDYVRMPRVRSLHPHQNRIVGLGDQERDALESYVDAGLTTA